MDKSNTTQQKLFAYRRSIQFARLTLTSSILLLLCSTHRSVVPLGFVLGIEAFDALQIRDDDDDDDDK